MNEVVDDAKSVCEEPLPDLIFDSGHAIEVLSRTDRRAACDQKQTTAAAPARLHINPVLPAVTSTNQACDPSLTNVGNPKERTQHASIDAARKISTNVASTMSAQIEENVKKDFANLASQKKWALAQHRRTSIVKINLTSRCNLRCVYCTVGTENHIDLDIPAESLAKIMQYVREMKPDEVQFGCFAETTVYPEWYRVVETVLDGGIRVGIISNLARVLEPNEIDVLSRCSFLQTSIDTIDCARQKSLRKNVDVRTILYNIQRVRGHALQMGRAGPKIAWIHVPTVETICGLKDYVGCAIACGVNEISIHPVLNFSGTKEQLQDIVDLPLDELKRVCSMLTEAGDIAGKYGVTFAVSELEMIKSRLAEANRIPSKPVHERGELDAALGRVSFNTKKCTPGNTRLCLDPWNVAMVSASGDLYPCTVCGTPIGNLRDFDKLEDILSSDSYVKWRLNLINGTPGEACLNCPIAAEGSTDALAALVLRLPRSY